MIRTHKPRGYAWTCASLFQQTPDFRNISYESCLVDDHTDDFAPSERSAKRQRVEQLADDFLNGHALNIPSARLPPQDIQHAVSRSFPRPKDARRAMAGLDVVISAEAVWEDVQDQWEVLHEYNRVDDDLGQSMMPQDVVNGEVVVEIQAQASCTSNGRQRVVRLAIGPSDGALRQAAALRNRTLSRRSVPPSVPSIQRTQSEAMVEETQEDPSHSSLQVTVSEIGPTPTAAWTSSKWLQSGMLEPRHKTVDEECSKDELGLSSLPTPSQKAAARPAVSLRRGRSALSQRSAAVTSSLSAMTGDAMSSMQDGGQKSDRTDEDLELSLATAYVLIPPPDSAEQDNCLVPDGESQGNSQPKLLRQHELRAAPQRSWTSSNAAAGAGNSADSQPAAATASPNDHEIRATLQDSVNLTSKKAPKGKRATKSTGAAPPVVAQRPARRESAPSESQAAAQLMADLPVDQQHEEIYKSVPGKDSSPFMFRKRVSKFNVESIVVEKKQALPTKTPRHGDFPSDSPRILQTKAKLTSTVSDPKTPLVNQFLNRRLPNTGEAGSRSSSVRKALRDEMLLAGAEFSRVEGEVRSSQEGSVQSEAQKASPKNTTGALTTEAAPEVPPVQLWPGTQVLLAEAQKDLFNSPNKENTTLYLGDQTTPQTTRNIPRRQPLQTLSQEPLPMPSTQALLDGWQGWSSIKKPRSAAGKRTSILPSPSSHRGKSNHISSEPVTCHSFDEARLRKSSLRYSMSYNDTPDPQQTESLPMAAFFHAQQSALNQSTNSTSSVTSNESRHMVQTSDQMQDQRARRPSGGIASSATFTQGHFQSTTEPDMIPSLSHADSSSRIPLAPPRQLESSISFSPIANPAPPTTEQVHKVTLPNPLTTIPPRTVGLSTLLSDQDSWSFSPLASPRQTSHAPPTTDPDTPAHSLPSFQQAQDLAEDVAGRVLSRADMDSQELNTTVMDLMGDVLGSARRGMPRGVGGI